jgi:hypothetical protein
MSIKAPQWAQALLNLKTQLPPEAKEHLRTAYKRLGISANDILDHLNDGRFTGPSGKQHAKTLYECLKNWQGEDCVDALKVLFE